ncbi:MAG: alanine racemase [bacterium]
MKNNHLTWIEIDKKALLSNLSAFTNLVGKKVEVMPVVKSNAYGHGLAEVVGIIKNKVKTLCVVNVEEGLNLRKLGFKKRIVVLGFYNENNLAAGIKKDIELPIYTEKQLQIIAATAKKIKRSAKVHIKIDTGNSRLGKLPKDFLTFFNKITQEKSIKVVGLYSHFSSSEDENLSFTNKQLQRYSEIIAKLPRNNFRYHIGCSASTLNVPTSYFSAVRIGIGLYGLWPSNFTKQRTKSKNGFSLQPVLSLKSKIIQIKEVPAGSYIGYSRTKKVKQKTKVAVVPVGYYDGLDRLLSNNGEVTIQNKRCPIIGNICMNMFMVNATKLKNVKEGEVVTIIGQNQKAGPIADEIAKRTKTINYEVVTRLNPTIQRIVK